MFFWFPFPHPMCVLLLESQRGAQRCVCGGGGGGLLHFPTQRKGWFFSNTQGGQRLGTLWCPHSDALVPTSHLLGSSKLPCTPAVRYSAAQCTGLRNQIAAMRSSAFAAITSACHSSLSLSTKADDHPFADRPRAPAMIRIHVKNDSAPACGDAERALAPCAGHCEPCHVSRIVSNGQQQKGKAHLWNSPIGGFSALQERHKTRVRFCGRRSP